MGIFAPDISDHDSLYYFSLIVKVCRSGIKMADDLCNIYQNLCTGLLFQIMKGYSDRVLNLSFAFSQEKRYSQDIFKDKKGMLPFTTWSHESVFSAKGSLKQAGYSTSVSGGENSVAFVHTSLQTTSF